MKHSLAIAITLASGFALSAAAQTPAASGAPAGPTKIAVIAFEAAVGSTNEGQRNFAELQKKFAPREAQLKALNDEIESLTKQLQAQGDKLSPEEQSNRAKTIEDKRKQLQRDGEDLKNDGAQAMQEMYASIASKVYDVMSDYAQKHGYTLVLDVAQQQTPVLYATESTNITKAVVEAYNVKSGVPAPQTPAASTAPRPAPRPAPAKPAAPAAH
jgi:outer membrane protein